MDKQTIRDIDVVGKRVLVRVDFNVPIENGRIVDDRRIRESLPTIRYLLDHNAAVILCSHLGRPKGRDAKFSLAPVASHLGELLGRPVAFAGDVVGEAVMQKAQAMKPGDVLVLENTRFYPEEEKNDPAFAQKLAALADIYVNDAFGSAHRAHASTEGVAHYLPAVAGFLMEKELNYLGSTLSNPAHPFVGILGGAKVSDKLAVIENLLGKVDRLLIGGGMANTFFKAQGLEVGDSLVENDKLDMARGLMDKGAGKIVLPVDAVIADKFANDANTRVVGINNVPSGWRILDIGPRTVDAFEGVLASAKTVVWNGPLGVFEMSNFAHGTLDIARRLAGLSGVTTIIGGGDSAAAVEQAGVADKITHISTGGGASLEFLEGKELPGVTALRNK
jgi:phosphoglycerate kinase